MPVGDDEEEDTRGRMGIVEAGNGGENWRR